MRAPRLGAGLVALGLGLVAPLSAQAPGGDGRPAAELARAKYKAQLVEDLTARLKQWEEAWNTDDVDRLEDFYTDDAVLRPPRSGALSGKPIVRQYLDLALPLSGDIQAGITDVEGSGRLAYVTGRWQHSHEGQVWSGHYVLVAEQGRFWRFRGHFFAATPTSEVPGLPALGRGGSEFDAFDLGSRAPEIRRLMDEMAGAWVSRDPVRMADLWTEDVLYAPASGERAFGKVPALDLWSLEMREGEGIQDVVVDFLDSDRFAFAFVQRIVTWTENGLLRTRAIPATLVFFRTRDGWRLRGQILLAD